jgi:hypothetical protein
MSKLFSNIITIVTLRVPVHVKKSHRQELVFLHTNCVHCKKKKNLLRFIHLFYTKVRHDFFKHCQPFLELSVSSEGSKRGFNHVRPGL